MTTPVMRNGILVGNPLAGADSRRITNKEQVLGTLKKAEQGRSLNLDDLTGLMKARREAGIKTERTINLAQTLADMKKVFGS